MNDRTTRYGLFAVVALVMALPLQADGQSGPQHNWVPEYDMEWGVGGAGFGRVGVCTDGTNIFTSTRYTIQARTMGGEIVHSWGGSGSANGQFGAIYDVACDATNVYAADYGNRRIQVFSKDGAFSHKWGSSGSGEGQFNTPRGIAVDHGRLYAADLNNNRIQVFTTDGDFLFSWGSEGGPGSTTRPIGVAVAGDRVYVILQESSRIVKVFTTEGQFLDSWATPNYPLGIGADATCVYVGVWGGGSNLVIYDLAGAVRKQFSAPPGHPVSFACHNPFVYVGKGNDGGGSTSIVPYRRIFRTLGSIDNNAIAESRIIALAQRPGTFLLDVDYMIEDHDDTNATLYAGCFLTDRGAPPDLNCFHPMRTFAEGTASNVGPGIAVGEVRRLSWDMAADGVSGVITNMGNVKVLLMCKDDRDLLDLHFLSIPAVGSHPAVTINRQPLYQDDLQPLWLWQLAAGDTGISLSTGVVAGVGGSYDGQVLAQGTATTEAGRGYLFELLGIREATAMELQHAREASTPGTVTEWQARRMPPPANYRVNEFNFVTSPTNGWWVVKP